MNIGSYSPVIHWPSQFCTVFYFQIAVFLIFMLSVFTFAFLFSYNHHSHFILHFSYNIAFKITSSTKATRSFDAACIVLISGKY